MTFEFRVGDILTMIGESTKHRVLEIDGDCYQVQDITHHDTHGFWYSQKYIETYFVLADREGVDDGE